MNCYSRSILACISMLFFSCKHEINKEVAPQDGNYPPEIAKIIVTRCATSCHNAASYKLSGGLLLDTWEHLFNGGSNGASVVAYSPDNSPLLYFINTDSSLGLVSYPTMPYNTGNGSSEKPLTRDEYMTIRNWIANGAPDKNGNIPFASDVATRQKYYMACQGSGKCRLVGVIDAEKRVVMRYIDIGVSNLQDIAHNIRVSPDGRYAYVCFYSGHYLLKIDTYTDQIIAKAEIGTRQWSVMNISPDGKSLLVSDWETSGSVYLISTDDMKIINVYNGAPDNFHLPHGLAANATFDTFYTAG